jgi:sec-independent protein translocase protein TatB
VIDFGFDKIALIAGVALLVIGPERMPKVARTVGHLFGKMQRYVADVKAEVSKTIELEELKNLKGQLQDAARNVEQSVSNEIHQTSSGLRNAWEGNSGPADVADHAADGHGNHHHGADYDQYDTLMAPIPAYRNPNKRWRLMRSAVPRWYKRREGLRISTQSGAARVARFRPTPSSRTSA